MPVRHRCGAHLSVRLRSEIDHLRLAASLAANLAANDVLERWEAIFAVVLVVFLDWRQPSPRSNIEELGTLVHCRLVGRFTVWEGERLAIKGQAESGPCALLVSSKRYWVVTGADRRYL